MVQVESFRMSQKFIIILVYVLRGSNDIVEGLFVYMGTIILFLVNVNDDVVTISLLM